jgi:hypothetical protein
MKNAFSPASVIEIFDNNNPKSAIQDKRQIGPSIGSSTCAGRNDAFLSNRERSLQMNKSVTLSSLRYRGAREEAARQRFHGAIAYVARATPFNPRHHPASKSREKRHGLENATHRRDRRRHGN